MEETDWLFLLDSLAKAVKGHVGQGLPGGPLQDVWDRTPDSLDAPRPGSQAGLELDRLGWRVASEEVLLFRTECVSGACI